MIDVVVIGAGVAGLVATRMLRQAGANVVCIEARPRIGGRAWTEWLTPDLPFDIGASWLHAVDKGHPWVPHLHRLSVRTKPDPRHRVTFDLDGRPSETASRAFARAIDDAWQAMERAAAEQDDVSADEILPKGHPWADLTRALIGPWLCGVDTDDLSVRDWVHWISGEDWFVDPGVGEMVRRYAADLEIETNTVATAIDVKPDRIDVGTSTGRIEAKTAICTVPLGVLAAGDIVFTPALEPDRLAALDQLPMGLLMKLALVFDDWEIVREGPRYLHLPKGGEAAPFYCVPPFGRSLLYAFCGGRQARALEAAGEQAAVEALLAPLIDQFGEDCRRRFRFGMMTRWGTDPFARGSYAMARPGGSGLRPRLARPHAGRLFFAGEATDADGWAATVAGAYRSGERAAREAIELLQH